MHRFIKYKTNYHSIWHNCLRQGSCLLKCIYFFCMQRHVILGDFWCYNGNCKGLLIIVYIYQTTVQCGDGIFDMVQHILVFYISLSFISQDWSITSGPLTASIYILLYSFLLFGVNTLCRRSIRRMYADADAANFAAVVQDWKMMPQTIHFDLSAAKRKAPGDMMGTFFGNLTINGRSFSTSPVDYVQPKFYNLLMGYDLGRSIDLDRVVDIDIKDVIQNRQNRLQKRPKDFKWTVQIVFIFLAPTDRSTMTHCSSCASACK